MVNLTFVFGGVGEWVGGGVGGDLDLQRWGKSGLWFFIPPSSPLRSLPVR